MEWTIQDLGSLGELIGALAVVATLLYVGLQVKQNTKAVRSSTMQAVFESTQGVWKDNCSELSRNEKLFELASKEEHSPAESLFYVSWATLTFRAQENIYYQQKLGIADESALALAKRVRGSLRLPIYRRAWDDGLAKPFLSEEYITFVENALKSN